MKKVMITEMLWSEFRDAMAVDDLVILPVGSVEEHGPHNPLGTDYMIAAATAKAIGERVGAPVAPVMPIGNARSLMGFPGTATLDPELLREVMFQVCRAFVKHGARRFLFINGHGGNTATLKMTAADLFLKYGVIATQTEWWITLPQMSPYPCDDHGGQYETSMLMAIDETLVDMTKAQTVPVHKLTPAITFEHGFRYNGARIPLPVPFDKLTPVGNVGAPAEKADLRLGRKMFAAYVDYCSTLAEELRKIPLQPK